MIAIWKGQSKATVLVHSDQGSQYGSADYTVFLQANNLESSMSREETAMIMLLLKASLPCSENA